MLLTTGGNPPDETPGTVLLEDRYDKPTGI